jgi:hypothetical protein
MKIQLMSIISTQKQNIKTPKSTPKIIIRSTMKQTLKWRLILEDKSRHAKDKIYLRFKHHSKTIMQHYIVLEG